MILYYMEGKFIDLSDLVLDTLYVVDNLQICKFIVGGKIVPGFGYNSSDVRSDVLIYNTEKDEWESIGDLHSPAFSHAVSVVNFNEYANYIC